MPRGFNEREKESIRKNLLEAGRARLVTLGMMKTSVEDLARVAHISKGAFYQFFPSKEALFITLFAEAERDYRHQLREFARRPGRTPSARLLQFFREALRCYRSMPLLSKFSRDDMNALMRSLAADGMREAMHDDAAFLEELFEIWRSSGLKVNCTPDQLEALFQIIFFSDLYVQELGELVFGCAGRLGPAG
jgi:AcrR family transcriptional regulator